MACRSGGEPLQGAEADLIGRAVVGRKRRNAGSSVETRVGTPRPSRVEYMRRTGVRGTNGPGMVPVFFVGGYHGATDGVVDRDLTASSMQGVTECARECGHPNWQRVLALFS